MISIDSEHSCLLELIKAALFNSVPKLTDRIKWLSVFESAKMQSIVPLVASSVPVEHRSDWLSVSNQSKAYFLRLLYEQNSLVDLFKKNSIPFVILKGTSAAIYYPHPSSRTFGDVDVYISEEYLDCAIKLLEDSSYLFELKNDRHYEYVKNGIEFELHTRFSCKHYNNIDHIVLNGLNNAVEYRISNYIFPGLPKYENGIVLLGHIMQHLNDSGIGLRQIIDWMLFVYKELNDSAWNNYFKPLAIEAGLEDLAVTVTFMCKKYLGLACEITWCDYADEEAADKLLIRVLDDGNFGCYRAPYESVKTLIENEGFFKYLQRAGMVNWPLAQKCAIFRPFAWLYQLCRFTNRGVSGIIKGNKVFKKDKHF